MSVARGSSRRGRCVTGRGVRPRQSCDNCCGVFLDANVLIDVLEPQSGAGAAWSRAIFTDVARHERQVPNVIVIAELAGEPARADADVELIEREPAPVLMARAAFREYSRRGGPRRTILLDFLIAGHAGARLLARDHRLASYFPDLTLITPETDHG